MKTLTLHKGIKSIMLQKDISAVSMAKSMGVSRNTIFNQVGANANPTLKTLEKYAELFGVNVSDVILEAERFGGGK